MNATLIASHQDQRLARPDESQPAAAVAARAASIIQAPCAFQPAAVTATACKRKSARGVRGVRGLRRFSGFTLIELMIAVSVAGVLSSVALPSFEGQLQKARRSDVLVSMMQVQAAQERYRSNSASYGSLGEIGAPGVSASGHYTLQTTAISADGYDVLATATGTQARDTACLHMKLSSAGANLVYASGPDASVANIAAANRKCWSL